MKTLLTLASWLVVAAVLNAGLVWLTGYPVVYCLGAAVLAPLAPVLSLVQSVAGGFLLLAVFMGWWSWVAFGALTVFGAQVLLALFGAGHWSC